MGGLAPDKLRPCCLSVFPHGISKTNADRITGRDVNMVHHEAWKPVYFGDKGHEARKNIAGVGHGARVSAGLFREAVIRPTAT